MGVCAVCFLRDIAGALEIHKVGKLSYLRPEIMGFILGSFIAALIFKEFQSRSGSSPIIRFFISFFVSLGALVFLGCPIRMMARLTAGDPTAISALLGLMIGAFIGVQFLKKGFSLGRTYNVNTANKWIIPVIALLFLVLLLVKPGFMPSFPETGHAPLLLSLVAGLLVGYAANRTRLCTVGAFRDIFLMKDLHLFSGILGVLAFAFILNLIFGQVYPGAHPGAHTDNLWNFWGLFVVGIGSTLIGGCPLRQMVLAGSGNADSGVSVLGMIVGAGLSHNFGMVSAKGATLYAKYGVAVAIIFLLIVGFTNIQRE